jgi:hypothetical protein
MEGVSTPGSRQFEAGVELEVNAGYGDTIVVIAGLLVGHNWFLGLARAEGRFWTENGPRNTAAGFSALPSSSASAPALRNDKMKD